MAKKVQNNGSKTVRISVASHSSAKTKAKQAGIRIARFIEMAIESFDPVVSLKPSDSLPNKKAG